MRDRDHSLRIGGRIGALCVGLALAAAAAPGADDPLDPLDDALSVSGWNDAVRARVSGTLDLEVYHFQSAAPGLIFTDQATLFNPRLSLFLDAQLGSRVYFFAVSRADRGFDTGDGRAQMRLDEYAVRITPWEDDRLSLQIGKFATVVGNWTPRHGSWEDPFITAPLPYDNLTGIWDTTAARSGAELLAWAGIRPPPSIGGVYLEKYRSVPVIWGPSYASGSAVFGELGMLDYAAELKNASLSSRPETWDSTEAQWSHPTLSGRVGFRPDEAWTFGVSASTGPYLRTTALIPAGTGLGDYRETVIGQDAGYSWHHWQLWAELFEARFAIPGVGNAGTTLYYAEARYAFTPQFFGAVRWNQEFFSTVPVAGSGPARWGRNVSRADVGPGYRFTPHTQLKLQYSLQREDADQRAWNALVAMQLTVKF